MSEENKTIVRRYVEEGLNQENLVLFDELLAADFANHSPRLGIMGWFRMSVSRAGRATYTLGGLILCQDVFCS